MVLTIFGITSTTAFFAFVVAGRNTLLDDLATRSDKVESVAAQAADRAKMTAYDVEQLQRGMTAAATKLDAIHEQLGSTAGKLDLLIQMQTSPKRSASTPAPRHDPGMVVIRSR